MFCIPVQICTVRHGDISYPAAIQTVKMVMKAGIPVIPALAACLRQFLDNMLLFEEAQVAVYRAKAYIGHLVSNPLVDPVCSRMRIGSLQYFQD